MKLTIIGGSGLIGSKVVNRLRDLGHEALAASPRSGVNTLTAEGLADALASAAVVVDVSNPHSFADEAALEFFTTSTRNLLTAAAAAGVGHYVALSVVGTERLAQSGYFRAKMAQEAPSTRSESGYFRAKIAQEALIMGSSIPYSIVRATQFFEFITGIADLSTDGTIVRVAPALIQPIAADDVAGAVAEVSVGAPVNGIVEIAGPEPFRLDDLIRRVLSARDDPRTVVTDPHARYSSAELGERTLLPGADARLAGTPLEDWLNQSATANHRSTATPALAR